LLILIIDCQHKAELERDSDRSYRTRNIKAKNIIQLFSLIYLRDLFFIFLKNLKLKIFSYQQLEFQKYDIVIQYESF